MTQQVRSQAMSVLLKVMLMLLKLQMLQPKPKVMLQMPYLPRLKVLRVLQVLFLVSLTMLNLTLRMSLHTLVLRKLNMIKLEPWPMVILLRPSYLRRIQGLLQLLKLLARKPLSQELSRQQLDTLLLQELPRSMLEATWRTHKTSSTKSKICMTLLQLMHGLILKRSQNQVVAKVLLTLPW